MSVLVVSHFENAFKMIDMKRSLKEKNELLMGLSRELILLSLYFQVMRMLSD